MIWLLLVSFIWAFSFGLIKGRLAGVDPAIVAFVRMAIATAVFLPFLKPRALGAKLALRLLAIGALQFGLMYLLYLHAYRYLQAHEIALFTILTPFYLALLDAIFEKRWRMRYLAGGALAVVGGAVVTWHRADEAGAAAGFFLVQGSNLCFAAGQILYRRARPLFPDGIKDHQVFAWLATGAAVVAGLMTLASSSWTEFAPTIPQILVLLYLGAIASGLGFFLWNFGATQVNAGLLSVFNNLKIPLGILCSLVFFQERTDLIRLLSSLGLLLLAIWLVRAKGDTAAMPARR
ncbi:MAG: EamA family transporter [Opitutaceae bacterium]|nr:EamA family transporter [Opitutaceae bacterium]